ncbi:hypothetical protein GH714_020919 [Hevea brasiliensis]|uniref:Ubiquinol oxidase n=1 Tax=Hevea brasiliensis TaxID=3981 RepID=A0A6A6L9X7_HEVBR|nr:hypothetical protein GH714_020919 [Hevea brasiliensis]
MAASLSPTLYAISVSSTNCKTPTSFGFQNICRYNPHSSHRLKATGKLFRVQATVLRENEEKVVVEETFQPKTITDEKKGGGGGKPPDDSSSNALERWVIKLEQSVNVFLTDSVIKILDALYRDRDYARFFVLETIARVPYFGIGGNDWWFDRFLAQHIAIIYYIMTVFMYTLSPRMAYHFSECVESHAYETYDKFIKAQGEELKKLPAPEVAVKYYTGGDLYLFDEFQTSRAPQSRRPEISNERNPYYIDMLLI